MDCGPTCLRIIAAYYGKNYSLQGLREKCHISRQGVSLLGISDAAESIGFRTTGVKKRSKTSLHYSLAPTTFYRCLPDPQKNRPPVDICFRPGRRPAPIFRKTIFTSLAANKNNPGETERIYYRDSPG